MPVGYGGVKREALGVSSPPATSANTRTMGQRPESQMRNQYRSPSATSSSRYQANGWQLARSGAPSCDTRLHPVAATLDGAGDDESDVVLMQVKPRIKPDVEDTLHRLNNEPAQNLSFVQHKFLAIGEKVKECNDTLGELHALGISHVASLPELVVIGDQSSGKSSLMSAFAGIPLPRSASTCTRCPVHIRLSRSAGAWSCKLSLHRNYRYMPPVNVSATRPFGPWQEISRVTDEFITFNDKADPAKIEEAIRWAQLAILNDDRDYTLYIPGSGDIAKRSSLEVEENNRTAHCSPNVVALEISGPELPDLLFYDLPGLFLSPGNAEDHYITQVINNIAEKYISHPQAIILCAVPMNIDVETSASFTIVRNLAADSRTVGVLTKADLLPEGSYSKWLRPLRGDSHKLGHGYFITSRPSLDSLRDVDKHEESFFNRCADDGLYGRSWPDLFAEFEDRCGVQRLSSFLSHKLQEAFVKSLPSIKEKIALRLNEVNAELARLPDLPIRPEVEVRRNLMRFMTRMESCLTGKDFQARWGQEAANTFRNEITKRKPTYNVKPAPEQEQERVTPRPTIDQNEPISVDLTGDDEVPSRMSTPCPPSSRRRSHAEFAEGLPDRPTPAKRHNSLFPTSLKKEDADDLASTTSATPRFRQALWPQRRRVMTLQDVRRAIFEKRQPGNPDDGAQEVVEMLCMDATSAWNVPLQGLIKNSYNLLRSNIQNILRESFAGMHKRGVYKNAAMILDEFLVSWRQKIHTLLRDTYKLETHCRFTLDVNTFERHRASELRLLKRYRHVYRWRMHDNRAQIDQEQPYIKKWEFMNPDEQAKEEAEMAKQAVKLGPDPYTAELDVCARVRGYYLTAANRFADTASLYIYSGMIPDITEQICDGYLDRALGITNDAPEELFNRLMEEDVECSETRVRLKRDKEQFEKAMASIANLERSDSDEGSENTVPEASGSGGDVTMTMAY